MGTNMEDHIQSICWVRRKTLSTTCDMFLKSLPSGLRELCLRGGGKKIRARGMRTPRKQGLLIRDYSNKIKWGNWGRVRRLSKCQTERHWDRKHKIDLGDGQLTMHSHKFISEPAYIQNRTKHSTDSQYLTTRPCLSCCKQCQILSWCS